MRGQDSVCLPMRPRVNWILGHEVNTGWAYYNNFCRLNAKLDDFEHITNSSSETEIAIYFDPLIARDYPAKSKRSILRVGGPRPLEIIEKGNPNNLKLALQQFDLIIALNSGLLGRVTRWHSNVSLVPNGLDLKIWRADRIFRTQEEFTAGFAANIAGVKREIKGFDLARAAAERVGVPLLICDKEAARIPHERMVEAFYNRIDVLIHPSLAEGSSNVIMEALALGIPVITTRESGYHGEHLTDGVDALIRPRAIESLENALSMLKQEEGLRRQISIGARSFAEIHHSILTVAREYKRLFTATLSGI